MRGGDAVHRLETRSPEGALASTITFGPLLAQCWDRAICRETDRFVGNRDFVETFSLAFQRCRVLVVDNVDIVFWILSTRRGSST